MGSVFRFFSALLQKIADVCAWILAVFKQIFVDAWNIVTDIICWSFDQILSIAAGALNAINVPFNPQTYYSMIPAETAQILGYIGISQAFAMIVASLVIRFLLQTVPFVRWGS